MTAIQPAAAPGLTPVQQCDLEAELIAFIEARLNEEQRFAENAIDADTPCWTATRSEGGYLHRDGPRVETGAEPWSKTVNLGVWECDDPADDCEPLRAKWMRQAEHIARWDPARVLAGIARHRLILEACDDIVWDLRAREKILRTLAAPYAAHPGFRPEWSLE